MKILKKSQDFVQIQMVKKLVKYEPFLKEIIERGEFFDCRTRDDNKILFNVIFNISN